MQSINTSSCCTWLSLSAAVKVPGTAQAHWSYEMMNSFCLKWPGLPHLLHLGLEDVLFGSNLTGIFWRCLKIMGPPTSNHKSNRRTSEKGNHYIFYTIRQKNLWNSTLLKESLVWNDSIIHYFGYCELQPSTLGIDRPSVLQHQGTLGHPGQLGDLAMGELIEFYKTHMFII